MQLTINGEPREAAPELTVLTLLEQIGLNPGKVAVERNREIVPRSRYGQTPLAEGDQLEIVQFVGGG
ncbi:MAG: sulfur carrier protein ThiS [Caulobacterales bacterium]|jgi:thiamine biosynthesis protein ThiS